MHANAWTPEAFCLHGSTYKSDDLAREIYLRVCRTDFSAPGFCLVDFGSKLDSETFRRIMLDTKEAMAKTHESSHGKTLVLQSAARFDQQETTRPHLDGGPDECFLMLGYEPSSVDSQFEIADYARCAFELGLSPKQFLAKHNPMFQSGYELIRPYSTKVECFERRHYQIVCVNNSAAEFNEFTPAWQGTLHTATILTPDESKRRVINSTVIASAHLGAAEPIDASQQLDFVTTSAVRRRGYDKTHLSDDE